MPSESRLVITMRAEVKEPLKDPRNLALAIVLAADAFNEVGIEPAFDADPSCADHDDWRLVVQFLDMAQKGEL